LGDATTGGKKARRARYAALANVSFFVISKAASMPATKAGACSNIRPVNTI
jgi:hypothetical protein